VSFTEVDETGYHMITAGYASQSPNLLTRSKGDCTLNSRTTGD